MLRPDKISENGRFNNFDNKEILYGKKKQHLPAMGWNSWNAFGSGNTEALTKAMVDKMVELGLDKLGYQYVVLDDGCYKPERVDGKLTSEETKFPSGFKAISDYVHGKGLKFGMYNDIGVKTCSGARVGICGYEDVDAKSYIEWGVDFMKVDNCYYPFDNATFSNSENAAYTFTPNIKAIKICGDNEVTLSAVADGKITGDRAVVEGDHVTGLGTFDGTGPDASPVGVRSSELVFEYDAAKAGEYKLQVEYQSGRVEGCGDWLQLAVDEEYFYDDFLTEGLAEELSDKNLNDPDKRDNPVDNNMPDLDEENAKKDAADNAYNWSAPIKVTLKKGVNHIRVMNHRRQENTLNSYSRILKALNDAAPDHDIYYSACEWGKSHPQNWAYKVCDCWRILNDITFRVGSDGDPGHGDWKDDYTPSVTTQYNKAVIMDEFAGLDKGWNDPDMLMVGMNGLDETQCKSHMTLWSVMNSPLMLGLDLRRVEKGDWIYNIIANEDLIALNQDALGIQAKRVYSTLAKGRPDKEYIRDINRVDILVKPLTGDRLAITFFNVSQEDKTGTYKVSIDEIKKAFGDKIKTGAKYSVKDVWTKEESENTSGVFEANGLKACDSITVVVTPN
ncbi:glycoside hydrolase family 27 protein [Butyrivibrio sp. VCD2006]|uniref:glycoside hydrolase family 27 protein n=1 Tax=Butyrivibrio sp. VCD2006 TaxID=1280664 RepID=UPI0003FE6104|nr:glycoside hydrolase family 27 protein [Butyrivibrio sp. VCD2006]